MLFTVAALLPIVNPLGSAPIFLDDRRFASRRTPAAGDRRGAPRLAPARGRDADRIVQLLRIFGVSLPIVRVAGGLLVTAAGWRLLNDDGGPEGDPGRSTPGNGKSRAARSIR